MARIDPAEARALLGGADGERAERAVEPRDFRRPRRLSQGQRGALESLVTGLLPAAGVELAERLGEDLALRLQSVGEVSAEGLFQGEGGLPCVLAFTIEGAPGWAAWESEMAVAAVEQLFGVRSSSGAERELSELESGVLVELLAPLVRRIASALDAEATDFALVQSREELARAAALAAESDGHRLEIELTVDLTEDEGTLRCYLPGLRPSPGRRASAGAEPELPPAVRGVPVTVHARLEGSDVPLTQLLSLEVGDVIPLEDRVDSPVVLFVGDERYATAHLGTHRGKLAVRVERIEKENER